MSIRNWLIISASCLALLPLNAWAEYSPTEKPAEAHALTLAERMALAREFVAKVTQGYKKADKALGIENSDVVSRGNILPDGEELLFRVRLKKDRLVIESPIYSRVENKTVLISFRDFIGALEFPIEYNSEEEKAQGWYIREKKTFVLDVKNREVKADQSSFRFSDKVKVEDDDVLVPVDEIAQWFGFSIKTEVFSLNLFLESPIPLPVQEAIARRNRFKQDARVGPSVLPLQEAPAKAIDYPFVDVSSVSSYNRPGDGTKPTSKVASTVRTTGDVAYGTLTTQSLMDKDDYLRSVRATYKRESLKPELLGPLNARKYEIGDVYSVTQQLQQNSSAGLGARVSNEDPRQNYFRPSTEVAGTYFPDWDVELYRNDQLMDFQTIGEDGQYRFENVDLYSNDNDFRLVFYGPQGEIREEAFNVPVNTRRLSDVGTTYDVGLVAQKKHVYEKGTGELDDEGMPLLTAAIDQPIGDVSMATLGLEAGQMFDEQRGVVHTGFATTLADTLLNFDAAIDNNSEMAGQIVARRDVGKHQIRNEIKIATDEYTPVKPPETNLFSGDEDVSPVQEIFKNEFNVNGPLNIGLGLRSRYNLGLSYQELADGFHNTDTSAGIYTIWKRVALGQQLVRSMPSEGDDTLSSKTTLTGSLGKNRIRLMSDYQIQPESNLERIKANLQRRLTSDIDLDLGVEKEMESGIVSGGAQLNWDAGFANISPSITYDSENNLIAGLNTRFGLVRDPGENQIKSFDRAVTSSGGLSAFVYYDKDGNNVFDGEDEPIEGAVVKAPQNGGQAATNEKGYALFRNMLRMKLTDVYLDASSLKDPFWVPGYEGASIVPREGHIEKMEFPVHMAGEIDGTIYGRTPGGTSQPMRGISVSLYDLAGNKKMTSSTESDGFFLLTKVPPGTYYMSVDEKGTVKNYARPLPQKIHIGYEGTTLYGHNIYMDSGNPDVPISILAKSDINEEDAQKFAGKSYAINLGSFKSQLMMGLVWFKVKNLYASMIGGELIDKPSQSYPDKKTGKYSLRVALNTSNLQEAYQQCRDIANKGQDCSLEILPGALEGKPYEGIQQASVEATTNR